MAKSKPRPGRKPISRGARLLRDRDRRNPEHDALQSGGDRARVGDVVAEVGAVVDPGDDQVGPLADQAEVAEAHAVDRRAVGRVGDPAVVEPHLLDRQRRARRDAARRRAAVRVGDDHVRLDPLQLAQRAAQGVKALGADSVVVGEQHPHLAGTRILTGLARAAPAEAAQAAQPHRGAPTWWRVDIRVMPASGYVPPEREPRCRIPGRGGAARDRRVPRARSGLGLSRTPDRAPGRERLEGWQRAPWRRPAAHLTGVRPIAAWATARRAPRCPPRDGCAASNGVITGGTLAILADIAFGCSIETELPPATPYTTAELSLSFLRPARPGRHADGRRAGDPRRPLGRRCRRPS